MLSALASSLLTAEGAVRRGERCHQPGAPATGRPRAGAWGWCQPNVPARFSMSLKAVRLNSLTYPVEPAERAELEKAGIELTAVEGQQPADILEAATDCDALLVISSRLPGQVIERLSRCRVISRL